MKRADIRALLALSDRRAAAEISFIITSCGLPAPHQVACTYDAMDAMVERDYDLFIIDAAIPMSLAQPAIRGGMDFIRFLRMCEGRVGEAPVVFLRSRIGDRDLIEVQAEVARARDAGANCVLTHPLTAQKFDEQVIPEFENPRPFLRLPGYTGPCRRRQQVAVSVDRRKSEQG